MNRNRLFAVAVLLSFAGVPCAAAERNRTVFVLHSGLHTILSDIRPNRVTERIRDNLVAQGVPERDIVLLDNPFPVASWKNLFPPEAIADFVDSTFPGSAFSRSVYVRLHQTLAHHGVRSHDRLVWVGHSAGGQVGVTMAHLAHNLDWYPDLAGVAAPYRFDTVVTLGSPLGADWLPDDVKFRMYYSAQDRVLRWACLYGNAILHALGHPVQLCEALAPLGKNGAIRIFDGIEHPCWDEDRVIARLISELNAAPPPAWQTAAPLSMGSGLGQLFCRALGERVQLSFEDPPVD